MTHNNHIKFFEKEFEVDEKECNIDDEKEFEVDEKECNIDDEKDFEVDDEKECNIDDEKDFEVDDEKDFEVDDEKECNIDDEKEFEVDDENEGKILCTKCHTFTSNFSSHKNNNGKRSTHCKHEEKCYIKFDEYSKKCVKIHNDAFKYYYVEGYNTKIKLKIKHKICGVIFYQLPASHARSKGHKDCKFKYIKLGEDFIGKALIKYPHSLFNYDEVVYRDSYTSIIINCKLHGRFECVPHTFLTNTYGCPHCALKGRTTSSEEFFRIAKSLYGNHYDYSESEYIDMVHKIKIICKIHGDFLQTPSEHITQRSNCKKCSYHLILVVSNFKFRLKFKEKAKIVHQDKYDYSKSLYIKSNRYITIICRIHGEFLQKPASHLNTRGCPICCGNYLHEKAMDVNFRNFLISAYDVHGNRYNYSKSIYKGAQVAMSIQCTIHGEFLQMPQTHLYGFGCQKCTKPKSIWQESINMDPRNRR